jgi:hypothetical protein
MGEPVRGLRFERQLAASLADIGLRMVGDDELGIDLATEDRAVIVEVKVSSRVLPRDVAAAATRLALAVRGAGAQRAVLAWWASSFSRDAQARNWLALTSILAPEVAARLQLVMVSSSATLVMPDEEPGLRVAAAMREAGDDRDDAPASGRADRSYEIVKILLLRWLRDEPPISMGELQAISGLSHPTVLLRVRELGAAVERTSNRAVRLKELPVRAWTELLALSARVRETRLFEDRSGRAGDPSTLIARLRRQRPPRVAIGGVIAAQHWQPSFDLVGVPRIDLEVHAPSGSPDLRFVSRLDPALAPARADAPAVLAVHAVTRAASLFEASADGVPWADPVETLLDLHQLRLVEQADDFVKRWKRRR